MTTPIRILLVDDDSNVRRGLRMRLLLDEDLAVVGEAADGAAGVEAVIDLEPDVVILDINMPVMDGVSACQRITGLALPCRVVMLSLQDDDALRHRCREAGATAFVCKDDASHALLPAIRRAATGT
jgi:DNA-binding NarL/FixJ family response regulator